MSPRSITASLAAAATLATAAASAHAKSVRVTITRTDESVVTSYVVRGDQNALYLNPNPDAPVGAAMPMSQIQSVYWEEPEDWKAAWRHWTRREFDQGATAFAQLAKDYANIAQVQDSYGARAVFYHGECLRRTGKYAELMQVFEDAKRVNLSDRYRKQVQLFNYWGHAGEKLWEPLKLITDRFEVPVGDIGQHTVPPTTQPLRKIETDLLIQIAYLRGLATEMIGREEHREASAALDPQVPETAQAVALAWENVKASLEDYARVFTLTYMSDQRLARESMERTMAILKEDPQL